MEALIVALGLAALVYALMPRATRRTSPTRKQTFAASSIHAQDQAFAAARKTKSREIRQLYRELVGSRRYDGKHYKLIAHLATIYKMSPSDMRQVCR